MEKHSPSYEHSNALDFRADILNTIHQQLPEFDLPSQDLDVIVENLHEVYRKYGNPASETYLPYHNHIHSLDVLKRAVTIAAIHQKIAPDRIDDRTIALTMIAASGHDNDQHVVAENETDEQISARTIRDQMLKRGYPPHEAERVYDGIIATTADRSNGHVTQPKVREGSRDPLKLIVAMADIQSTTMEGSMRMLVDVPKLYFESTPPTSNTLHGHIVGLTKFLLSQYSFVSDRIDSVAGDLRHYYDEPTAELIANQHREAFRSHGLSAIHTAKHIHERAEHVQNELSKRIEEIPRTPKQASDMACIALRAAIESLSR